MTPDNIIAKVADHYGITIHDMRSRNRQRTIVEARKAVGYLLHERLGLSTSEAARLLNRDHTSIMYYCKCVSDLLNDSRIDPQAFQRLQLITS